jgi:dienelactone hydrolase
MTRHPSPVRFAIAACIASAVLASAPRALAGPSEAFHGPGGTMGLLYPLESGAPPSPAVLIVHDALGLDQRSHRYVAQLNAAGLLVLEVELRANPPDGLAEPLPGEAEAAELLTHAITALARDPRVDPMRIGALGFGIGARAVALAPPAEDGRATIVARLLLYPGCASLRDLLRASSHASRTAPSPVLVLHGEDDPANAPAECHELSAALGSTASVRRISYRGATYAWDPPADGGERVRRTAMAGPRGHHLGATMAGTRGTHGHEGGRVLRPRAPRGGRAPRVIGCRGRSISQSRRSSDLPPSRSSRTLTVVSRFDDHQASCGGRMLGEESVRR